MLCIAFNRGIDLIILSLPCNFVFWRLLLYSRKRKHKRMYFVFLETNIVHNIRTTLLHLGFHTVNSNKWIVTQTYCCYCLKSFSVLYHAKCILMFCTLGIFNCVHIKKTVTLQDVPLLRVTRTFNRCDVLKCTGVISLFFRWCSVEALNLLNFFVQLEWHGYLVMFLFSNLLFV